MLVIPGDLHAKTLAAAREQWHIRITPLESQEVFLRLAKPRLPNGFYITSYTQLATNGVQRMPDPDKLDPKALLDWLCLRPGQVEEWWRDRGRHYRDQYDLLRLDPDTTTLETLETQVQHELGTLAPATWKNTKSAKLVSAFCIWITRYAHFARATASPPTPTKYSSSPRHAPFEISA